MFRRDTRRGIRRLRRQPAHVLPLESRVLFAAGDLDTTFSGDGKVLEPSSPTEELANDVAAQSDGKVVTVGQTRTASGHLDLLVQRYNADGTLDRSFSGDGRATLDIGRGDQRATGVAIQPNGKIVVVGSTGASDGSDVLVVRYNTDGSRDPTFTGDGWTTMNFGSSEIGGRVAVQPDGRIVFSGVSFNQLVLGRLTASGAPDVTFSGDGKVTTPVDAFGQTDVIVQPDGRIVGVGERLNLSATRYNANGTVDTAFGTNGVARASITSNSLGTSAALDPRGRIVAITHTGELRQPAIVRFAADGRSQTTATSDFSEKFHDVTVRPTGEIVTAGTTQGNDLFIVRQFENGSVIQPDSDFGTGGRTVTGVGDDPFGANRAYANAVALTPDGRVAAAGANHAQVSGGGFSGVAVARYSASGAADVTFSGDGVVAVDPVYKLAGFEDVLALPGGKVLAAGSTVALDGGRNIFIAQFTASGSRDTSFSGDGRLHIDFDNASDEAYALARLPDGKILVAGSATRRGDIASPRWGIARLNPSGTLDTTFGGNGTVLLSGVEGRITGLAAQSDGKILAVGEVTDGTLTTGRLNPNGTLDTPFGAGGVVTERVFNSPPGKPSIAAAPGGKVVVAATGTDPTADREEDFMVLRYTAAGTRDSTFGGGDGVTFVNFNSRADEDDVRHSHDAASAVTVLPDGRVTVAGQSDLSAAVLRLRADGSLDPTFAGDGTVTVPAGPPFGTADPSDMVLLGDGRLVVGGDANVPFGTNPGDMQRDYWVAVIRPDGTLDTGFGGGDGVATADVRIEDHGRGLAVQQDGKIVVAGYSGVSATVLRFEGPGDEQPPQGAVALQAEQAELSGARVSSGNAGYTGTGYADYANASGDYVRWAADVATAGEYTLEFRYANGGGSDRPLELRVNGAVVNPRLSFPTTGSWSTWRTVSARVTLPAGSNTIQLTSVGSNGPNLDAVTIRPATTNPGPTTVQAESAAMFGARPSNINAGYTGGGYADYANASGDWVEFAVDSAAAGTRTLTFRHANGSSIDRPLELRVNGVVVNPRLSFAPTGSWTTWREVSVTTTLAQGVNRVRVTSIGFNGPNLDALTVA